jgi:hypothetical protein
MKGTYVLRGGRYDTNNSEAYVMVCACNGIHGDTPVDVSLHYVSKSDAHSLALQPDKQTFANKWVQEIAGKRQAEVAAANAEEVTADVIRRNEDLHKKMRSEKQALERQLANQVLSSCDTIVLFFIYKFVFVQLTLVCSSNTNYTSNINHICSEAICHKEGFRLAGVDGFCEGRFQ